MFQFTAARFMDRIKVADEVEIFAMWDLISCSKWPNTSHDFHFCLKLQYMKHDLWLSYLLVSFAAFDHDTHHPWPVAVGGVKTRGVGSAWFQFQAK